MSAIAPVVSVAMSAYNARAYLAEAVESILAQTFTDFEFLIIDDGSTDDTPAILQKYAERDARIRLVVRENIGLVRTLNELIGMARGEFLARMDADDIALPHRFERQVAFLRYHPEVVALGSRVAWIDPEGHVLREFCGQEAHEEIDEAHLAMQAGIMSHPAVMIRADPLRALGGYRTEFYLAEDFDLWLRLAEVGRLANFPEVLLKYRVHATSRGYLHQHRQSAFIHQAVRDACARRGIPEVAFPPTSDAPLKLEADHRMVWAWWALKEGNVTAARRNAMRRLQLKPLSTESWRLLACSLRGY
jgi:glycosyltransferase involved in cell wall biosynthesis